MKVYESYKNSLSSKESFFYFFYKCEINHTHISKNVLYFKYKECN